MGRDLLGRLRWGNIARACVVAVVLAGVAAWPRLAPTSPSVPSGAVESPPLGAEPPEERRRGREAEPSGGRDGRRPDVAGSGHMGRRTRHRAPPRAVAPPKGSRRVEATGPPPQRRVSPKVVAPSPTAVAPKPAVAAPSVPAPTPAPAQDQPAPPDPDPVVGEFGFER